MGGCDEDFTVLFDSENGLLIGCVDEIVVGVCVQIKKDELMQGFGVSSDELCGVKIEILIEK